MKSRVARLVVRPDPRAEHLLVLGVTNAEVLKPDTVYEIVEIMGEHIIRELGPSAVGEKDRWGKDANSLIQDADSVGTFLTAEEAVKKAELMELRQRLKDSDDTKT